MFIRVLNEEAEKEEETHLEDTAQQTLRCCSRLAPIFISDLLAVGHVQSIIAILFWLVNIL